MKKLCAIILPAFLCAVLSSCAWLYQVTGVDGVSCTEETTGQQGPATKEPEETSAKPDAVSTESAVLREGCYSNGTYVMELTNVNGVQGNGYHIIIYTPQYGIRMFIGSIREDDAQAGTFTIVDNDDPRVCLTVEPSEDGQVLTVSFLIGEEKNLSISGVYTYYDHEYWETEESLGSAVIAAGKYTYKGYQMTIVYEAGFMKVLIESPFGEVLLSEINPTEKPLGSVMLEGEWGSTILVSSGDGSGNVVVSGRSASDRTLQYAGIYTLS